MKFIFNIIKKFTLKNKPLMLGRWKINYNTKIINRKIDLSNEDNCGPCGQYVFYKKNILDNNKK